MRLYVVGLSKDAIDVLQQRLSHQEVVQKLLAPNASDATSVVSAMGVLALPDVHQFGEDILYACMPVPYRCWQRLPIEMGRDLDWAQTEETKQFTKDITQNITTRFLGANPPIQVRTCYVVVRGKDDPANPDLTEKEAANLTNALALQLRHWYMSDKFAKKFFDTARAFVVPPGNRLPDELIWDLKQVFHSLQKQETRLVLAPSTICKSSCTVEYAQQLISALEGGKEGAPKAFIFSSAVKALTFLQKLLNAKKFCFPSTAYVSTVISKDLEVGLYFAAGEGPGDVEFFSPLDGEFTSKALDWAEFQQKAGTCNGKGCKMVVDNTYTTSVLLPALADPHVAATLYRKCTLLTGHVDESNEDTHSVVVVSPLTWSNWKARATSKEQFELLTIPCSSNETLTQPWSNLRTIHSQLRYQCASARKIAQSLNKEADYCKDVTCPGFSPSWFSILNTDCKPEDCPAMLLRFQLKDCSKLQIQTFVTCLQLFKKSPIVGGIHSRVHILNNWIRLYIGHEAVIDLERDIIQALHRCMQ